MSTTSAPLTPTSDASPGGRKRNGVNGLLWVLTGLAIAAAIVLPLVTREAPYVYALLLTFPFAIIHGIRRYGWQRLLAFLVITFVVSNIFENLSIATGFPFGHYHYTGSLKLFEVPFTIGLIYFGLGYIAWIAASALLERADETLGSGSRAGRINLVALPLLAGAIMTMFDVGSDSSASTVSHTWVWEDGGGFFGVPFTNYLGWWFVTYVFFQIMALILRRTGPVPVSGVATPRSHFVQPVLIYGSLGLASISNFIVIPDSLVTDQAGQTWSVAALNETLMTINIFTLVIVAALGLVKVAQFTTADPVS
ncbi:MAG: carotenoid biosynthesis protein [Herbiconiux sp.]|uniref:carotenoid biosynthesis protein n=1 Tax=Herbiconiux sp. TaxID=1871186 RepID=UPI0012260CC5|nr:carotenoid biosynthesis protein [Herbiconiux sp.]TAJ48543.1 MAG: carotenoid biosynthesis protein [Herbiconiux sp.]